MPPVVLRRLTGAAANDDACASMSGMCGIRTSRSGMIERERKTGDERV